MNYTIEFSNSYEDICQVHDALYAFNLSRTGHERQEVMAKKIDSAGAYIVRGDDNNIYGGVVWHWVDSEENTVFVDYMFLDESLRGLGKGKELFKVMEQHVKDAGAAFVKLTTNTFQAPDFYLALGYEVTGGRNAPVPLMPDNYHYFYHKKL